MGVIWQGTKAALFCGAAYTLAKADVWGDNKATIEYVNSKCESSDRIKYYKMMIPSSAELRIRFADSWNNGVRSVFSFVDNLPTHTVNAACWTSTQIQQLAATVGESKKESSTAPAAQQEAAKKK
ncbi:uncharacterized protein LOC100906292 [Galendromus occidentalis]|uniref:MICOS complex subunit MIC13 n=1 Tax=Galendromus occidentalis TaxID=34638 RepID=A0AAJ6QPL4_9ACAR|nr:uncharacterized protein LOC100906292 [Galendromus occidentalis]